MNAIDIIEKGIAAQKQPENLRLGVAQVVAAMARVVESQGLWKDVWTDLHDVQGIRRKYPTRAAGIDAAGKAYNRVRVLLNKAAQAHDRPATAR